MLYHLYHKAGRRYRLKVRSLVSCVVVWHIAKASRPYRYRLFFFM